MNVPRPQCAWARRRCGLLALIASFGLPLAGAPATEPARDPLESGFRQPPPDARPKTWWHWMNDSVTKEGITADLEAMAQAGIGGVQVFNASLANYDTKRFVTPSADYLSPAWLELEQFALAEARRVGLDVAFNTGPGVVESGGPWITPDQAMQHLVWSELPVTGGRAFAGPVPLPPVHYGLFTGVPPPGPYRRWVGSEPADVAKYYRDVAVLAVPTPESETEPESVPLQIKASAPIPRAEVLSDHDLATYAVFPVPTPEKPVWIEYEFRAPITVRSAIISCEGVNCYRDGELQCSDDGKTWRFVAVLASIGIWDRFVPCTTAVPETRARFFRFRFFTLTFSGAKRLGLAEVRLSPVARLNHWEIKAAYVPALVNADDTVPVPSPATIEPQRVIDLTRFLRPDGTLDWQVPPGQWTLLRIGYAPMGILNSGAMAEGMGLEVDKLNRAAVDGFFSGGAGKIIAAAGPLAGTTLTGLLMDSWEVFTQNWTPDFPAEFARRRGYDLRPWLPVMTGRIIGNATLSERFLFDVRHTVSDLVVENHYGRIAELAHRSGLKFYAEAPGHTVPTVVDSFATKGRVDVPMGEFWLGKSNESNDPKQTAAAAQLYGKRIVAAESFTSVPEESNWQESPAKFKSLGDRYFADGLNLLMFHTFVHQPWLDRAPGLTLGPYGSHFERTNGWLAVAGPPWIKYLTRCQFLLQRGLPVIDVNFFAGEDVPNTLPAPDDAAAHPVLPAGFDYGGCSDDALLNRMDVRDGQIVLPDGMSFAVLVLPNRPELSVAAVRKLKELIAAGATVVGPRPLSSPTLTDYPQGDEEVRKIGKEVWGAIDGQKVTENRFGRGRVVWGSPLSAVLPPPDFDYDRTTGANLVFAHRRDGDTEIYFVANQGEAAATVAATFRVAGKRPELWDAETGDIAAAPAYADCGGLTTVPLHLNAMGSIFVVFRHPASPDAVVGAIRNGAPVPLTALLEPAAGAYVLTTACGAQLRNVVPNTPRPIAVSGLWTVRFPGETGTSVPLAWSSLFSWPDNAAVSIKYFSGTATYAAEFLVPPEALHGNQRVQLDLGRVEKFAGVTLNGRPLRTLWHPPYVMDVTAAVQPGQNHLELSVTNLLVNRLIGDQQRPENQRRLWSTHQPYTKDSPLLPSGLLGPVQVVFRPQLAPAPSAAEQHQ